MARRSMAKKKLKDIKCVCGWCARSIFIPNTYDKQKMVWLCEHCGNVNEAKIEATFAIGKIMENPLKAGRKTKVGR